MQYWTLYGQLFQKDGGVTGDESMSKQGFKSGISFDEKEFFYFLPLSQPLCNLPYLNTTDSFDKLIKLLITANSPKAPL